MPDGLTDNFDLTKPEDGASEDVWGAKLNANFEAIDAALYKLLTTANFGANTGTANALAVTLDPVLESLSAGQRVFLKVTADNTEAVTLAVDSTGVKDAILNNGEAIAAGVLKAGGIYGFAYDGTAWRLLGEVARATAAEALAGTDEDKVVTPAALAGLNTTSGGVHVLKLPGGYMAQAGRYAGGSSNPTINFPVAFSAAPMITLTAEGSGASTDAASNSVRLAALDSKSANSFSAFCSQESEVSDVFVGSSSTAFNWIAIGPVATS